MSKSYSHLCNVLKTQENDTVVIANICQTLYRMQFFLTTYMTKFFVNNSQRPSPFTAEITKAQKGK